MKVIIPGVVKIKELEINDFTVEGGNTILLEEYVLKSMRKALFRCPFRIEVLEEKP